MKMTLFVDASFCPKTGAGGWGAWAIRDGWGRGQFSGGPIRLRDYRMSSSTTAEIAGIALALWQLKAGGALDGVKQIMIQCDNKSALGMIYGHLPNVTTSRAKGAPRKNAAIEKHSLGGSPVVKKVVTTIRELLDGIKVDVRHVKGHKNPETDGRSWVNNQCDAEARRHMVALRKELAMLCE